MVLSTPLLVGVVAFGAVASVVAGVTARRVAESPPPLWRVGVAGLLAGAFFLLATLASTYFGVVPGRFSENLAVNAVVVSLPAGAVFGLFGFAPKTRLGVRARAAVGFASGCVVLFTGLLLAGQLA